ncbi:hypothetical protein LQE92_06020 [Lacrimispora sp. NSJ-141]|uniref:Uncharacterized protein n=1 Tax=Lientehia hominis TaxID=2897778 RepID=A0AAP2RIS1_9FIRM|nr:hypothetical protein [Lientehia hominis]MCD2492184.1 hypothetical protein [Lientehia hominis]
MLKMHFKRLFQSKRFYLSVLCVTGISLLSIIGEIQALPGSSIYYLIQSRHGIGAFFIAMSVVVVLPYGLNYTEDVGNHYEYGILSRGGRYSYCWSSMLITALSAFLTVFLGYLLLYFLLKIRFPMIRPEELEQLIQYSQQNGLTPYESLLIGNHPFQYFLCTFSTEAIGYAFMASVTLMASAKIDNSFVLLSIPVMLYYGCMFIGTTFKLPGIFRWYYMLTHGGYFAVITNNIYLVMLYVMLYFICLIAAAGLIFEKWVEGKRSHG